MAKKTVEEKKSVEQVLKELEKEYGIGAVMHGNEKENFEEVITTGSLGFDISIGIGGLPKRAGKIVELFGWESSGKSTISQTIIANFQKNGEKCLLVDGENSLDEKYAKALGINLEELYLIQLDESAGEGAYNKMERLVETGEIGLVIIDSYNSLQPLKIVQGEIGDSTLGLHARMLNQAVMKANYLATKYGTNFIFLGQLREKIGVMFGCLHADMPILFTDGRSIPIRKVVEEKIKGRVWSWNESLGRFEEKEIIDWHNNGNVTNESDYLHIESTGINGSKFGITVTPNHKLLTDKGWVEANSIEKGGKLLSKYESVLGGDGEEFLKGCLAGDSHLSIRDKNTASLRLQDSKNTEYVAWKRDILSCLKWSNTVDDRWDSEYTYEFAKLKKHIENRNPLKIFNNGSISNLALAVWIMDDAHYKKSHKSYILSIKRFKNNTEILDKIKSLFESNGMSCSYNNEGSFNFTVESSARIAEMIRLYVPECMNYKLPPECRNKKTGTILPLAVKLIKSDYVEVLSKRIASKRQLRQKGKYDISIQDNHNYLSGGVNNGVVVHNSPETTQGGNALKFYAHLRAKVSRSLTTDNSVIVADVKIGNKTTVKIEKNKLAPPFKSCSFNIMYGEGIDKISELIDIAHDLQVLKVYGKSITYNDVKHDSSEFIQMLKDQPELFEEIKIKVLETVK